MANGELITAVATFAAPVAGPQLLKRLEPSDTDGAFATGAQVSDDAIALSGAGFEVTLRIVHSGDDLRVLLEGHGVSVDRLDSTRMEGAVVVASRLDDSYQQTTYRRAAPLNSGSYVELPWQAVAAGDCLASASTGTFYDVVGGRLRPRQPPAAQPTPPAITASSAISEYPHWSARVHNIFQAANISTFAQLIDMTADDLTALPSFSRRCLREVEQVLAPAGLALRSKG